VPGQRAPAVGPAGAGGGGKKLYAHYTARNAGEEAGDRGVNVLLWIGISLSKQYV